MDKVKSIFDTDVSAVFDSMFKNPKKHFVIYTYYNKEETPLYIGYSTDFYRALDYHKMQISFMKDVEYVGFIFFDSENEIKKGKPYLVKTRKPLHNTVADISLDRKYVDLDDDLTVSLKELEKYWSVNNDQMSLDEMLQIRINTSL